MLLASVLVHALRFYKERVRGLALNVAALHIAQLGFHLRPAGHPSQVQRIPVGVAE
jgi:hypothetical protein